MITEKQLNSLKQGDSLEIKVTKQPGQFSGATFVSGVDDTVTLNWMGNAQRLKKDIVLKYGVAKGDDTKPEPEIQEDFLPDTDTDTDRSDTADNTDTDTVVDTKPEPRAKTPRKKKKRK